MAHNFSVSLIDAIASICGVARSTLYKYLKIFEGLDKEVRLVASVSRCRGIYFYTSPPESVAYPFVVVNVFNYSEVLPKLVDRLRELGVRGIRVIIDAGVTNVWRKPCSSICFDYDDAYWNAFWQAVDYAKSFARQGIFAEVTVPDYPDDYTRHWGKAHCLWVDSYTNIDRTLENIFYVIDHDKKAPWLLPAQGYENVPESVLLPIEVFVDQELHKRYRIAIANICTGNYDKVIYETIRVAREFCKECKYHVFGARLSAIRKAIAGKLLGDGDSFDSIAWGYSKGMRIERTGSVKLYPSTEESRKRVFLAYLAGDVLKTLLAT
jgi:hypothetical protein